MVAGTKQLATSQTASARFGRLSTLVIEQALHWRTAGKAVQLDAPTTIVAPLSLLPLVRPVRAMHVCAADTGCDAATSQDNRL